MTPEKLMAWVAVITLVGGAVVTAVGWFLHAKDEAQQKEVSTITKSVDALWKKVDELRDERHRYLTQDSGDKLRAELKEDIDKMGTRLVAEIDKVSLRLQEAVLKLIGAKTS